MQPLVSVVVPVYNVEKSLNRCVESLLEQTYSNLEVILVDDGSTDASGKMCDSFVDDRIKTIHKLNNGLGMARNTGIENAHGSYIMFIDSDDYLEHTAIEIMIKRMLKDHSDICYCRYFDEDSNGKTRIANESYTRDRYVGLQTLEILRGMVGSQANSKNDVEIGMSVWKGLFNLELIKAHSIKFESERQFISEDIIFHTEILPIAKGVSIVGSVLYHYVRNQASLTTKYKPERFEMECYLYSELSRRLASYFVGEDIQYRLQRAFLGRVRNCIRQEVNSKFGFKKKISDIKNMCSNRLVVESSHDRVGCVRNMKQNLFIFFVKHQMPKFLYGLFVAERLVR